MPPHIASLLDVNIEIGAAENDHSLDFGVALERVINVLLQVHDLPATISPVRRDDDLGAAIGKAVLDALRAKAAENHGMDGADTGAGKHRDRCLGHKGHVNKDSIPLFNAVALEDVCELAYLPVELAISDDPFLAGFTLPDDRCLVCAGTVKMTIQTVL